MSPSGRVFILEDQQSTRDHLVRTISQAADLEVCAAVNSLSAAVEWLESGESADVAVIDLALPDGNGIDFIRLLSEREEAPVPIVSTVFGDDQHIVDAIRSGAVGYVLKESESADLLESIRTVLSGGSPISPSIARTLLKRFRAYEDSQSRSDRDQALSAREKEVLGWIVKGYTYLEIAQSLDISVHTANAHIRHIYKKLAVKSRGEAVYKAIRSGLVSFQD